MERRHKLNKKVKNLLEVTEDNVSTQYSYSSAGETRNTTAEQKARGSAHLKDQAQLLDSSPAR